MAHAAAVGSRDHCGGRSKTLARCVVEAQVYGCPLGYLALPQEAALQGTPTTPSPILCAAATHALRLWFSLQGSKCVLIATFVLWPLVLASVLLSALMFTPLVPILGLPIFLPAFPRPRRQWRRLSVSSNPGTTDAAMYCQLVPEIANAMQPLVARGAFGNDERRVCVCYHHHQVSHLTRPRDMCVYLCDTR